MILNVRRVEHDLCGNSECTGQWIVESGSKNRTQVYNALNRGGFVEYEVEKVVVIDLDEMIKITKGKS